MGSAVARIRGKNDFLYIIKRDGTLYLLCLPFIVTFILFRYLPLYGITIAFKDFNMFKGILESPWVGFQVFARVFQEEYFWIAVRNTIWLNLLTLAISFPATIILALLLNELKAKYFKKITQSILYLPHFISWVIVSGLVFNIFSLEGSLNLTFKALGFPKVPFLIDNDWWTFTYVIANVWKDIGWGTIIYLAALTAIDPSLYESASLDGASRLRKMYHITLPMIRPTIVVIFILSISKMMSIGLDAPLLLGNVKVGEVSDVLSTYVYRVGLQEVNYSFATAVGLFQSVINMALLLGANRLAKLTNDEGVI